MKNFGHIGAGIAMIFSVASHAPAEAGPGINDGMVNLKTACAEIDTAKDRAYCARSIAMVAETLSVMAGHMAIASVPQRAIQDGKAVMVVAPPSVFNRLFYDGVRSVCGNIGIVKEGSKDRSIDLTDGRIESLNALASRAMTCGDDAKGKSMGLRPVAVHLQKHAGDVLIRTTPNAPDVKFEAFTFSP